MVRHSMLLSLALVLACGDDTGATGGDDTSTGTPDVTGSADANETDADASATAAVDTSVGSATESSSAGEESTVADTTVADTTVADSSSGADSSSDATAGSESTGVLDTTAPLVVITSPRPDRMTPVRHIAVHGTVTDDIGVASLVWASPEGDEEVEVAQDGTFTVQVPLQPGENTVTLRAFDAAGNEGEAANAVYFGHRVAVGNSQGAMLQGGALYTWGRNELGQLGNGTLVGSGWGDDPETADLPVRYGVEADGLLSIVTRQTFMIALRDDGAVLTWGSNANGQLGYIAEGDCGSNGTSACRRDPTVVEGIADAIAVQAGFNHSLVLLADGTVLSFGLDDVGQLGRPSEGTGMIPSAVVGLADVVQLAAGSDASYALTAAGEVFAWGENDQGQLGLGSADGDAHPVPTAIAGLGDVVSIAAANTTAYALLADGTVVAWGRNHAGQAGIGTDDGAQVLVPTPVVTEVSPGMFEPLGGIDNIAADGFVALAVGQDATVYAWGLGGLGQLGQGYLGDGARDLENRVAASPVAVDDDDLAIFDVVEIEVGAGGPSLARTTDDNLFGWGWSFRGSLGLEAAINAWAYSAPVLVFAAP